MPDSKPQEQPQQSGEASRAPQSAYEADAPRLERPAPGKEETRPLRDWASI